MVGALNTEGVRTVHHIQNWELRSASAHRLSLGRGCVLRITAGRVWITLEQGSEDIWLLPGQDWVTPGAVHLWISADPVARLQLLTPAVGTTVGSAAPARRSALRRWLSAAAQVLSYPLSAATR